MAVTPKKRPDPGRQLIRRRLWMVGLALFLIADVVLVAMALNRPAESVPDDLTSPSVTSSPTSTPEPEPTLAEPQALPTIPIAHPTRILEARDDALAWRTTTGPCPGTPASPERTVDGGASWKATNATAPTDVVSLQSIMIEGPDVASMVGQAASDCATSFIRTYVAGDNYERYPADLGGAWFVNPLDRAIVHSPAGDFPAPCANVMALAPIDGERAAALCDGQTLHVTTDAAAGWSPPVSVPGAMNLTESDAGYVIATVSTDPACAGVQLLTLPVEGTAPTPSGCFPTTAEPQSLAGNIAVSQVSGTMWLWAGDAFVRSADGGSTW
jgi:hypothetical protein